MTVRKLIVAVAVAALPMISACDDITTPTGPVICTDDSGCTATTEMCHPVGKICVPTCTAATDCPSEQKNCEEPKDATGAKVGTIKICKCSTSALCAGTTPDNVCNLGVDDICEAKCAADADCTQYGTNRKCDTAAGTCVLKGPEACTATSCPATSPKCDATTKACVKCTVDADCSGRTDGLTSCDKTGGACIAATCNPANAVPGTNGGMDICAYGQECKAGAPNACAELPAATCAGATGITWDKSAKGPVIYKAVGTYSATSDTATECADGGKVIKGEIQFYAPNGLNYTSIANLFSQIKFRNTTGADADAAFTHNAPATGAKSGKFTAGSCGPASVTGRTVRIVPGNPACL